MSRDWEQRALKREFRDLEESRHGAMETKWEHQEERRTGLFPSC